MKKLLVFALLFASTANAGAMKEIHLLTTESLDQYFSDNFTDREIYYTVQVQKLIAPEYGYDLAVESIVLLNDMESGKADYTCVTNFIGSTYAYEALNSICTKK